MTTAAHFTKEAFAEGLMEVVNSLQSVAHGTDTVTVTGIEVRSTFCELCMKLQISRAELPWRLAHIWEIASIEGSVLDLDDIVNVLVDSLNDLFGPTDTEDEE